MFATLISGLLLVAAGSSQDTARAKFAECLRGSMGKATTAKIDAPGFAAFARQECAAEVTGFHSALATYDMKAGWARKKADSDADQQIRDYLDDWTGRYKEKATAAK